MGKAIRASLLALLLCSAAPVARAGHIPNDAPTPPPQPATAAQEPTGTETQTGQPTVDGETANPAPDSLTRTALDLLAALSSLL